MKKTGHLHTIFSLLSTLLILCNSEKIVSLDNDQAEETETKTENTTDESINKIEESKESTTQKNAPTGSLEKNKYSKSPVRSERKLFINSQDSPILIVITDKNNKQHHYKIPAGATKIVDHLPLQIKKIVCNGNYGYKDIPISGTALHTYSVFVFTIDNKLEQYHFINIQQKTSALNYAKTALREARLAVNRDKKKVEKLTEKVEDIQDQTIYLQ